MKSRAFQEGYNDGLVWDLTGFNSINEVENYPDGWDEATINAIGSDEFADSMGCPRSGKKWDKACRDYNSGAHAGAIKQAKHNAPECFELSWHQEL